MHSRTIDVVTEWETVATPAGYEGLHQLADAEFSGAASAGTAWAFLLNGRIIGVFEGDIEDFAEADVTAYRAADPSLPLLFAMQERGGETRANYYTNETPLTDVDRKLSSGGFTGYIELSDNVLSGDYYVVYHGGKSMSVAFVGSSERLLTGEEAFETAADEVGIYEVVDVGVDIVDVPEPAGDADDGHEADAAGETAAAGANAAGRPTSSEEPEASAGGSAAPDGSADDPNAPADASTSDPASPDAAAPRDAAEAADGAATATDPAAGEPAAGEPAAGEPAAGGPATGDDGRDAPETGVAGRPTDAAGTDAESAGGPGDASGDPDSDAGADAGARDDAGTERTDGPDAGRDGSEAETSADGAESGSRGRPESTSRAPASGGSRAAEEPAGSGTAAGGAEPMDPSTGRDPGPADAEASGSAADRGVGDDRAATTSTTTPGAAGESGQSAAPDGPDGAVADERRWQEARTIPSLDPEKSSGTPAPDAEEGDRDAGRERTARMQRRRERRRSQRDTEHADATQPTSPAGSRDDAGGTATERGADDGAERLRRRLARARERVASLEAEREELTEERAELRDERTELTEERDRLRAERDDHADRIEELEAECDRLRAEVDRLESELGADADAGAGGTAAAESISPERALSGTNLFVRYDTKGQATLKHAHAGDAGRDDVRENLRLEHHTTFETDGVVVDDRPYEAFLHDSTEYTFARWVVSELLYEIGETGNRSGLAGVFDAVPDVDRVELHGEVGVETDDGVEQRAFDVICRDRMGDPLFVADINPSRNATTEAMVGSLVGNTGTVAAEEKSLSAGFYVTESFYEPGALETVAQETGGGILSRSKKRSFVKLSRKRGYHLCLVEARDGEFHLNVPEL